MGRAAGKKEFPPDAAQDPVLSDVPNLDVVGFLHKNQALSSGAKQQNNKTKCSQLVN